MNTLATRKNPYNLVSIYALRDPITGDTLYVGRSGKPGQRFAGHRSRARTGKPGKLYDRMRELQQADLDPQLVVLDEVPHAEASAAEKAWVAALQEGGAALLNECAGGNGRHASMSQRILIQAPAAILEELIRLKPRARGHLIERALASSAAD